MQLDFLTRLATWVTPREKTTRPVSRVAAPARADDSDIALTSHARELLRELNCPNLAARLAVRWNPRMRTTAGLASYHNSLITLNPKLVQFGESEIDKTLRHELAHLLAHDRAGRRRIAPHGAEWKRACRDLGLPDEKRCHDLPLPRRKVATKHTYQCPSCRLDVHRVKPFRRKVACLACCRAHSRGRYDDKFRLVKTR